MSTPPPREGITYDPMYPFGKPPEPAAPLPALGRKVTAFENFDTFPKPEGVEEVSMVSDEFTANCPVTNQPDWYTVQILYNPDALCLESKSLKLYLHAYRNEGMFCEALASKIAREISDVLKVDVRVTLTQKARGGVSIETKAQHLYAGNGKTVGFKAHEGSQP